MTEASNTALSDKAGNRIFIMAAQIMNEAKSQNLGKPTDGLAWSSVIWYRALSERGVAKLRVWSNPSWRKLFTSRRACTQG